MKKIIKLTERQLREAENRLFSYSLDSDVPNCAGNSEISVGGKLNNREMGEPKDADYISNELTPQGYGRYWHGYGNFYGALHQIADYDPFEFEIDDSDDDIELGESKKKRSTLINEIDNTNYTTSPTNINQVNSAAPVDQNGNPVTSVIDQNGNQEAAINDEQLKKDPIEQQMERQPIPMNILRPLQLLIRNLEGTNLNMWKSANVYNSILDHLVIKNPAIIMYFLKKMRAMIKSR